MAYIWLFNWVYSLIIHEQRKYTPREEKMIEESKEIEKRPNNFHKRDDVVEWESVAANNTADIGGQRRNTKINW